MSPLDGELMLYKFRQHFFIKEILLCSISRDHDYIEARQIKNTAWRGMRRVRSLSMLGYRAPQNHKRSLNLSIILPGWYRCQYRSRSLRKLRRRWPWSALLVGSALGRSQKKVQRMLQFETSPQTNRLVSRLSHLELVGTLWWMERKLLELGKGTQGARNRFFLQTSHYLCHPQNFQLDLPLNLWIQSILRFRLYQNYVLERTTIDHSNRR